MLMMHFVNCQMSGFFPFVVCLFLPKIRRSVFAKLNDRFSDQIMQNSCLLKTPLVLIVFLLFDVCLVMASGASILSVFLSYGIR